MSVSPIASSQISAEDARRAGHDSLDALLAELHRGTDGTVYRIELGSLRPDPRVALRDSATVTDDERRKLLDRLTRFDTHATDGPWTLRALELIGSHPGLRAGNLCRLIGQDKKRFKLNVRKLKSLRLTESLETGYRLSPRGIAFLRTVGAQDGTNAS